MIRFYCPDILRTLRLPESDSGHCLRVLRMHPGDEVEAVNGRGTAYTLRLLDDNRHGCAVEIVEQRPEPPSWPQNITIAVAPTKNLDRMEWMVEKLTEIGVNRITPLLCERSERRTLKPERLERIAVAAMKQSLKATLPIIDHLTPLKDFVNQTSSHFTLQPSLFIAYCGREVERKLLSREYRPGTDVTLLIGPEGDFAQEEVTLCLDQGYVPVTLGDNRLRTETAALVGCDTFHIITQRL